MNSSRIRIFATIDVDPDSSARVVASKGNPELDAWFRTLVTKWKFAPAREAGIPREGLINLIFRVDLTRDQYEEPFPPRLATHESPGSNLHNSGCPWNASQL
jgi:hypothetical protein